MNTMIARIWNGRVRARDYDSYTSFMKERAIPDYQETDGLEIDRHFLTLS